MRSEDLSIIRQQALSCNPDALYIIGLIFENKSEPQTETAKKYYRKAADCGSAEALGALGRLLYNEGNTKEALNCLFGAAESGDAELEYSFGLTLYLEKEYDLSAEYLVRAAEKEYPEAFYALGRLCLRTGRPDMAEWNFRMAAERGVYKAVFELEAMRRNNLVNTSEEHSDKTTASDAGTAACTETKKEEDI